MALKRMDNVPIVVDDPEAVKAFFIELGLELEGETTFSRRDTVNELEACRKQSA